MTHFASSEAFSTSPVGAQTREQEEHFFVALERLRALGVDPGIVAFSPAARDVLDRDHTLKMTRNSETQANPFARLRHLLRRAESSIASGCRGKVAATVASNLSTGGLSPALGVQTILNLPLGISIVSGSSRPSLR